MSEAGLGKEDEECAGRQGVRVALPSVHSYTALYSL